VSSRLVGLTFNPLHHLSMIVPLAAIRRTLAAISTALTSLLAHETTAECCQATKLSALPAFIFHLHPHGLTKQPNIPYPSSAAAGPAGTVPVVPAGARSTFAAAAVEERRIGAGRSRPGLVGGRSCDNVSTYAFESSYTAKGRIRHGGRACTAVRRRSANATVHDVGVPLLRVLRRTTLIISLVRHCVCIFRKPLLFVRDMGCTPCGRSSMRSKGRGQAFAPRSLRVLFLASLLRCFLSARAFNFDRSREERR
jgi:hypothetical protein